MKLLVPLGLLGLLGLVALLIIYLIKPNYQKKSVSSTYVWKLSLKIRRRRNPINRLQDLFLLICQILAILACTAIMAWPVLEAFRPEVVTQKIAVIDGSASMLAETDGETRFDRALEEVRTLATKVAAQNGEITVILAGETASFVTVRTTQTNLPELTAALDEMAGKATAQCTYGSGDVDGAMQLAEQVLNQTPQADVLLYTAKSYLDPGDVEVVDVSDPSEYNVAILDSVAILEENYYTFSVDMASYGRAADVTLNCEVYGVNGVESAKLKFSLPVWLESDTPQTVLFNSETTGSSGIFSYSYAYIYVSVDDSFSYDNMFYIYGGTKETVRIQYASTIPNIFFRGSIMSLRETLRTRWDIEFVEVNANVKEPELEGFDFYIFERVTPKTTPKDGVVMFVNPSSMPNGLGLDKEGYVRSGNMYLSTAGDHPITKGVNASNIFISQYSVIRVSEEYDVLLGYQKDPVFAVRNEEDKKIVIMAFELQNTDLPLLLEFPKLFLHTFNYFFPSTVTRYNYEVGESVELNARAPSLTVSGPGETVTLNNLPETVKLSSTGTYTLTQTLFNGKNVIESIYAKIPNAESDFTTVLEELENPYVETVPEDKDYDLLLYFAAALVALLFAEWWLNSRAH